MTAFTDLVDFIRARRAHYARAFDGDLARLRSEHGSRNVEEAQRQADADEKAGRRIHTARRARLSGHLRF
jgi:hypothetical protein